jgi:glycerophosphoryl diester phosphodiesterase
MSDFWHRPPGAGPRIIGHRGARGVAPENTLGAFAHAVELGAAAVELDVRTCASGELVVFHDPTFARMTEGRDARRVADLSFAEISHIGLPAGERVPLLAEVLALLRPRSIGVNVEMKRDVPDRPAVVRATAAVLVAGDPQRPVIVSSFDPQMLRGLARLAPEVPRALLIHRSRYHPAMIAAAGPTARLTVRPVPVAAVHLERTIATPGRVAALQARGLWVNVWTVNDAAEAARLASMGVDGLITDVPSALH